MKRIRAISLSILTILLLILACGPGVTPGVTPGDTLSVEDEVNTAVPLTRTAEALMTEAAAPPTEAAAPASDTPAPTATDTPVPIPTDTPVPSATPFCDRAGFVSESIPDGMDFEPDTPYTKSWRLSNAGGCTWTSGYSLVFDHGDLMSAPTVVPLGGSVAPGQEVDVIVDMVSPSGEGTYTGHWMLRNDVGVLFGLGSNANLTFWVEIDVVEPPPIVMIIPDILVPIFPGWLLPRTDQVYEQSSIPAGDTGYTEVSCPSGSLAVGGGFAASSSLVVYNSSPRPGGWIAYARNNSASSKLLNAYAICLYNTGGSISRVSNSTVVPAGGNAQATATCPSGSIVTGGGFASNSSSHWVYATLKGGSGWSTWAHNTSGVDRAINTYAVCLSDVSASTSQVFAQSWISGNSSAGGEVVCPANTLVTGGGYYLGTGLVAYNSSMKGSDDSRWNAFARNSTATPRLLNTYATCLSFP